MKVVPVRAVALSQGQSRSSLSGQCVLHVGPMPSAGRTAPMPGAGRPAGWSHGCHRAEHHREGAIWSWWQGYKPTAPRVWLGDKGGQSRKRGAVAPRTCGTRGSNRVGSGLSSDPRNPAGPVPGRGRGQGGHNAAPAGAQLLQAKGVGGPWIQGGAAEVSTWAQRGLRKEAFALEAAAVPTALPPHLGCAAGRGTASPSLPPCPTRACTTRFLRATAHPDLPRPARDPAPCWQPLQAASGTLHRPEPQGRPTWGSVGRAVFSTSTSFLTLHVSFWTLVSIITRRGPWHTTG